MARSSWDEYFFNIAKIVATRATCPRKQVGAVLVYNKRIISTGYNGSAPGEPHCTDIGCMMVDNHCKRTIHAEMNAFNEAIEFLDTGDKGSIIYCTLEPCEECQWWLDLKRIEVKYLEEYHSKKS